MSINKEKVVMMNDKDNVVTTIEKFEKGTKINLNYKGQAISIDLINDIPFGHKIALRNINKGEKIVKYGETIGVASRAIKRGEHVHVQNVESCRGRGDKIIQDKDADFDRK